MSQSLKTLWGVGEVTVQVFAAAKLYTIGDVHTDGYGQRLQEAINRLEAADQNQRLPGYWKALGRRCDDVAYRIRNAQAKQVDPYHLLCPLTLDLLKDPVVTPSGITYEREALLQHLDTTKTDPQTRQSLREDQLYPNLALRDAVDDYRKNYAEYSFFW
ncbi:hypothetical protein HDU89_006340 [Geranomyces variabilis]|nr:hypothetical protein HDU89_006340 [Geranomyces variabilis]